MFQEYKKGFKLGIAAITTEGIKQVQEIELPEITEDCIEIPVYDFTEKEYLEHKRKRNERVFDKFGYETVKPRRLTREQLRQQRELMEDLMLEIRY